MVRVMSDGKHTVYVYVEVGNKHHLAHCNVRWADGSAQVMLPTLRLLAGTALSPAGKELLYENLELLINEEPPQPREGSRMSATTKWDALEYQRIIAAERRGDALHVRFEDGARVVVDIQHVLPDIRGPQWEAMIVNPFEVVIPTLEGQAEVPWSTIRLLTDRDYSAHLAEVADEEAKQIGLRLKELRTRRNLTSKELAERAGITPQSLSRIEHGRHDVVFTTLRRLLAAMGYGLKDLAAPPPQRPASVAALLKRLATMGIDRDLILHRILPEQISARVGKRSGSSDEDRLVDEIARGVSKVFNWSTSAILGGDSLQFEPTLVATTRFKVRGKTNELRATAYTFFAHYLALTLVAATRHLESHPIPADADQLRQAVQARYGAVDFEHVLDFAWDCGVPVLPLRDPGAFHGACWRIAGRSVIVLKQVTDSQARWLFDLLHELKHVASHLSDERPSIVEGREISPMSLDYRDSAEEVEASEFAGAVILGGRAEELAQACVERARGSVEQLKRAVEQVAAIEHVPSDALANYVAFRLAHQGISWWGAANNLQVTDPPPWLIAREVTLERAQLQDLDAPARDMLLRAMTHPEEN